MLIIPAIDLKDGKVVRLTQGKADKSTFYHEEPLKMAKKWKDAGCQRLHVIDLDGAFAGQPKNIKPISDLNRFCKDHKISIQVGGGIRDLKTLESLLREGVDQVILGTVALESPKFFEEAVKQFPQTIILSVDAAKDTVFFRGWQEKSDKKIWDFLPELAGQGLDQCFALIYTDISRDGTLLGPNFGGLKRVLDQAPIPVIAAGGISHLKDLLQLKSKFPALFGVITGKAIYEGTLDLREALRKIR